MWTIAWEEMNFSRRTSWDMEENAFAAAVRKLCAQGDVHDLTVSNPTACGFNYAADLAAPLSQPAALHYQPEPFGMMSARDAVAGYYRDHNASVIADRICLTTSTSEAYSYLFRLLCDPGDEVLIARPSYPLFEFIASLDNVRLVEYPLLYDGKWSIDFHALEQAITSRTRAIIVVHPNNPTGHFTSAQERDSLRQLCVQKSIALIVDEVFLDYALPGITATSFAAEESAALSFVLSGISKICALPQMKCSWIAAIGPEDDVQKAIQRLEIIADTFLSMNAPMQFALPVWLASRGSMQAQIRERVQTNLTSLDSVLSASSVQRLSIEAGWSAVLRVPRTVGGLPYCEAAVARGIILHPGEFYGLTEGRAVISLITPPQIFSEGVAGLLQLK